MAETSADLFIELFPCDRIELLVGDDPDHLPRPDRRRHTQAFQRSEHDHHSDAPDTGDEPANRVGLYGHALLRGADGGGHSGHSGQHPGTAGAAATPLDGYPMAKAGKGQQALAMSFVASSIGGLLTTVIALATMPILARVGFYMHSVEMIVVMLFGISLIASIASQDMLKGLIAGFLGLMIGSIGTDVVYATPRGTFGFLEFYDGVPLIPALVGLFAVSEAFIIIEKKVIVTHEQATSRKATGTTPSKACGSRWRGGGTLSGPR